jgi:hypothetical protein
MSFLKEMIPLAIEGIGVAESLASIGIILSPRSMRMSTSTPADVRQQYTLGVLVR